MFPPRLFYGGGGGGGSVGGAAWYAHEIRRGLFVSFLAILALTALIIWLGVSKANTNSLSGAPLPAALAWVEYPGNPIYDPYPFPLPSTEDYWPWVIFDGFQFDNGVLGGGGVNVPYRMWHQGPGVLALSESSDGIHWTLVGELTGIGPSSSSYHAVVLYDRTRFGGSGQYHYKIYFWQGAPSAGDISVSKYAESNDGLHFVNLQTLTQDPARPLTTGIVNTLLYHFYGFASVYYNPVATNTTGRPWSFPFTAFYDIAQEGVPPFGGQGSSSESVGLAYSLDGKLWVRFGQEPVLIPSGQAEWYAWDGSHAFRATVSRDPQGIWQMYYSGSDDHFVDGLYYAHGIGHAVARDGVNWARDPYNPIFHYLNGEVWRNDRSYAPFVLCGTWGAAGPYSCKMWFSGGTFLSGSSGPSLQGAKQAIGYATYLPPQ